MKRLLFLFATPILLQSCSSMYIPAVRSIPLLDKKGEFQGEAGVSSNSVYVNGSYALSNGIAASINGNLSFGNFTDYYDIFTHKDDPAPKGGWFGGPIDTRGKFAHRYGEVSMGRINMLLHSKAPKLEVFGGIGMGKATDVDNYRYQADYCSLFGQVNVGWKKSVFEAGASVRLAYSIFNYAVNHSDNSEVLFQNTFNAFHIEPMPFIRIGGDVKFTFRFGINFAINDVTDTYKEYRGFHAPIGNNGWEHTSYHISVGLSYRFPNNLPNSEQKLKMYKYKNLTSLKR